MAKGVDSLVQVNINFLKQGIDLLKDINDDLYVFVKNHHFKSGVGVHMRHILDHYLSLIQYSDNKIDYDARDRDKRIETDRLYAMEIAQQIIEKLSDFNRQNFIEKRVLVKSNEETGDADSAWSHSSIKRELQFLASHTVHHYALISIILRILEYNPTEDFGVAPSTLIYQRKQQANQAG